MQGTIVFSYASVMIQVIPSALVSSIKGGVYRHMNRQDDIVLDGSGSYDPDDPADVRNNLRYCIAFKRMDTHASFIHNFPKGGHSLEKRSGFPGILSLF